jgi:Ran GTPase-activating protein (RanGAP) involved in mRNA processing and transport
MQYTCTKVTYIHIHTRRELRRLNLSHNALVFESFEDLCASLTRIENLSTLILSHNYLSAAGSRQLAAVVPRCSKLTCLHISCNDIGGPAIVTLSQALIECSATLTDLDLSNNELSGDGVCELASRLPQYTNLKRLRLGHTFGMGVESSAAGSELANALPKCTCLMELDLR